MNINITYLQKAFLSLEHALHRSIKEPSDLEVRDACIQRFEYTFELSIKTIKRYLEQEMPIPEQLDQLNYRDLLRIAFEAGLVAQAESWFQYREARNQTSHTYDERKAGSVYAILPSFIEDTRFLLTQLEHRLQTP
jgi:nucleotidyltransferase substrate binding protein (TIGR01987 family)